jgi:hypothetical protein
MGNKLSAPLEEAHSPTQRNSIKSAIGSVKPRMSITSPTTSQRARTTPRSIDVLDAASLATLSLKPSVTGNSPPKHLATTLRHRRTDRSALTFFACGRNVFVHFAGMALLERKLVKATPGTKVLEHAAEQVWKEVAMFNPKQRAVWEDAANQAKAALASETVTAEMLLEAHCMPHRKAEYQEKAAHAVDDLLARYADGTWPKNDETWFSPWAAEAANRALSGNYESKTTKRTGDRSIERDLVSAINLRDLPSQQFIGVEPSIKRFNLASSIYSRDIDQLSVCSVTPTQALQESYPYPTTGPVEVIDAASTARLYLDLNMTPPRSNRDSLRSIATSLHTDIDAEAEIITTERITPVKAKIIDC